MESGYRYTCIYAYICTYKYMHHNIITCICSTFYKYMYIAIYKTKSLSITHNAPTKQYIPAFSLSNHSQKKTRLPRLPVRNIRLRISLSGSKVFLVSNRMLSFLNEHKYIWSISLYDGQKCMRIHMSMLSFLMCNTLDNKKLRTIFSRTSLTLVIF